MDLETEEREFLEDLVEHVEKTSEDLKKTLKNASVPLKTAFRETYPETFGPYSREEEEIIDRLIDKKVLKIKVRDREVHQSLEENEKSKRKKLARSIGVQEDIIDELLNQIGEEL